MGSALKDRAIKAAKQEPANDNANTKSRRNNAGGRRSGRDPELAEEIARFNLLKRIQRDTGEEGRAEGSCIKFHHCPICGHHDDLAYYPDAHDGHDANTCYCYSKGVGGDALSYLIESGMTFKQALRVVAPEYADRKKAERREEHEARMERTADKVYAVAHAAEIEHDADLLADLEAEKYGLDDKSYSRLFGKFARGSVRWVGEENSWRCWDGRCWRHDEHGDLADIAAKRFSDALLAYGSRLEDGKSKEDFVNWARTYLRMGTRKAVVRDSRCELMARIDDFDRNPYLLNCKNCTIDIRTLETHPHDPEDMITLCAPVSYDAAATCEEFEAVVARSFEGEPEVARYLQKVLGLGLLGLVNVERMWFFYGMTRSGKGTIVGAVNAVLGTDDEGYAKSAQAEILAMQRKDSRVATPQIARLSNSRLVTMSEPDWQMTLDVGLIKQLTGGDEVTARHLNQGVRGFIPQFAMIMMCNNLPVVTDMTLFDSDRAVVVEFKHQVPESERDEGLKRRLASEASKSGILNWLLDGYAACVAEGLKMPAAVREATTAYGRNSDKVELFFAECMAVSPTQSVRASDVYDAYREWCADSGLHAEGKKKFFAGLRAKGLLLERAKVAGTYCKNVVPGYAIDIE